MYYEEEKTMPPFTEIKCDTALKLVKCKTHADFGNVKMIKCDLKINKSAKNEEQSENAIVRVLTLW